ncbi:MAG: hypothetical protein AAGK00_08615 [Pseudomonadota bacterium]
MRLDRRLNSVEALLPYTRQVLSQSRRMREAAVDLRQRSLDACHRSQALLDSLPSGLFEDMLSAELSNGS